jgi:hypothetical protein
MMFLIFALGPLSGLKIVLGNHQAAVATAPWESHPSAVLAKQSFD